MEFLSRKMEDFVGSIIYTGSELNQRSFGENESWNSLQSTVLAGQLSINENTSVSWLVDPEDPCDQNLDVLYENTSDVFFDLFYDFGELSSGEQDEGFFPDTVPDDSGVPNSDERNTGDFLQEMLDEMDDMDVRTCHSTPLSADSVHTQLYESNLAGVKRVIFSDDQPEKSSDVPSPSLASMPIKVAQMKKIFEEPMVSPTTHTQNHLKIARARKNSAVKSPRKRQSSGSEYPSSLSNASSSRRKSSGDESSQISIVKTVRTAYARYKLHRAEHLTPYTRTEAKTCNTLEEDKSDRKCKRGVKSAGGKKVSAIMNRKSFGFVSSPVKPVNEIRKLFSPTAAKSDDDTSQKKAACSTTHASSIGSAKKLQRSRIPKIIIQK